VEEAPTQAHVAACHCETHIGFKASTALLSYKGHLAKVLPEHLRASSHLFDGETDLFVSFITRLTMPRLRLSRGVALAVVLSRVAAQDTPAQSQTPPDGWVYEGCFA
jgi:hypothetical protein